MASAVVLAQTCHAAYTWMVPEMYRSVTLGTTRQLLAFHRTLMDYVGTRHALGSYVRHLWIGPVQANYSICDMRAVAKDRPTEYAVSDIICACSSLRALSIINATPDVIGVFVSKIPATVETLYVGQVFRSVSWDWRGMPCYPRLRRLVTCEFCGYWSPAMYRAIISSPHLRICRRYIYSVAGLPQHVLNRFDRVTKVADTLERMEMVACLICLVADAEVEGKVRLQYEDVLKATISPDRLFIEVSPMDKKYFRNHFYTNIYNDWVRHADEV
ncbi:hypothetical protein DAEQUDRAFT_136091 [Daedalea quercina L-15889]|uniref:Uncharacterized protein n=1 Tax=Daedalea quercina L-15889 TaxID=1314783 RepID=A0A165RRT8_9APHY|nr:hypothetical protein DAEQUDRAFT_136091 [Daedalea quercina L-15889]